MLVIYYYFLFELVKILPIKGIAIVPAIIEAIISPLSTILLKTKCTAIRLNTTPTAKEIIAANKYLYIPLNI